MRITRSTWLLIGSLVSATAAIASPSSRPVTVVAAPAPPADAAQPADWDVRVEHGIALAKVAQPEDIVVPTAMHAFDTSLVTTIRATETFQHIESVLPGFTERYYAAARGELEKILYARMPRLWQRMAEAYAVNMTPQQIDEATKFFGGPTGRKLVRVGNENFNAKTALVAGARDSLGSGVSAQSASELKTESTRALLSSVAALSPGERAELAQFSVSPAGRAAARSGAAVTRAQLEWMNEHDPDAEARMAELAMKVVAQMQAEQQKPKQQPR